MLYKRIDPRLVESGQFGQLKTLTQRLLWVIASVADYNTGEFYHSVGTLAKLLHVSRSSVKRGLRELERTNPPLIRSDEVAGKVSKRVYIFAAKSAKDTRVTGEPPPGSLVNHPRVTGEPGEAAPEGEESQQSSASTASPSDAINYSLNNWDPNNNGWLPKSLYFKLTRQYGEDAVTRRVVFILNTKKKITNPVGYLVRSLQEGWIPAESNEDIQRRAAEKAREARLAKREQEELAWEAEMAERDTLRDIRDSLSDSEREALRMQAERVVQEKYCTYPKDIGYEILVEMEERAILKKRLSK